jgi:hypothetical protein
MTGAAIASAIVGWLIIIGVLAFCFSKSGNHGEWED